MNRTTTPTRVLSVLLAAVLVCTLIPSQSFTTVKTAFAAQPQEQPAQTDEQAKAEETSAATEESTSSASSANIVSREVDLGTRNSETDDAAQQQSVNETASQENTQLNGEASSDETPNAADKAANIPSAQTNTTAQLVNNEIEVVSVTAPLNSATTTMVVGGLTYVVNPSDPTTVALTGVADSSLKGELLIPAEIEFGSNTYKIISVENSRGGVHR